MRSKGRSWLRRLTPALAATLLGLSGIGLATAAPAAADGNMSVALAVTSPLPGAAAGTMYVGQKASYALTVTATNALSGVSFTDTLPADVTYTSVSGAGWSCSSTPDPTPATTSTLACTQANAVTAGSTSTAAVVVTVSPSTTLPSVVFNPAAAATSPAGANATLTGPATVPIAPDADLSLTMSVPAASKYNLTVTNSGPSAAAGPLAITDTLPAGINFISGLGTGWNPCTASAVPAPPSGSGATVTCTRASGLPAPLVANDPNSTTFVTITFSVTTGNSGRITTPASVSGPTFDPQPTNNTAQASQGAVPYGTAADPGPCGAAVNGVRTCKLVANTGTVPAIPGVNTNAQGVAQPIPIWGFAMDTQRAGTTCPTSATPAGTVPGPTLIANEGETLQLMVRNRLPANGSDVNRLAVNIPGLPTSHPDSVGVPTGSCSPAGSLSYTWANLKPGTYLYEAGGNFPTSTDPIANGARQVAMGLSGLLIVRPTGFSPAAMTLFDPPAAAPTGNACNSSNGSSQFTAETLVQVNELSSEFHRGLNPFNSTMVPGGGNGPINSVFTLPTPANNAGNSADRASYVPDVFLINGKAYPATAISPVSGSDCVALHYVDMGMLEKSFGVLGRRQIVMADDSVALAHPQNVATKYLNPGEEVDAVVDMTGATPGSLLPIMDFGRHLHNGPGSALNATSPGSNTGMSLGGQLALIQVNGVRPATLNPTMDLVGLDHTTVAVDTANVFTPTQLNLSFQGIPRAGAATIAGGQYTIDNIPALDASGVPQAPPAGTITGAFTTSPAAIATPTLTGLGNGDHIIWVRLRDSANHWSDPPSGVVFTFDRITGGANPNGGPVLSNLSLNPSLTNGATPNSIPGQIGRTDTATVTAGSATVTDYQIGLSPADAGQSVSGVGIPPGAIVGNVQPGLSFTILVNGVATPATANGTTVNIGVPGVPAVSADMVIDGTATPPLPDWAITSFDWSIDGGPSTNVVLPGAPAPGSPVEITTVIPQAVLLGLSGDTTHTVSVTATETQGTSTRTSNPTVLSFTKTATGPTATIDSITPNPAGPGSDFLGNANYFPSVRIRGTFNDSLAQIAGGEMWFLPVVGGNPVGLDTQGRPSPDGQGVPVTPDSGLWNAPAGQSVPFLVDIPSAEFTGLPQGPIRIYVHGKDAAGQWNQTYTTATLTLDKTPPVILGSTTTPAQPDPTVTNPSAGHYTLTFYAQDPATAPPACTVNGVQITPQGCGVPATSKVTAVEWLISDPNGIDIPGLNDFTVVLSNPSDGPGPFSVDVSGGPQTNGAYPSGDQVHYRIRDGAGNWTNWSLVTIP